MMNNQRKHTIRDATLIRLFEKDTSQKENELIESWLSDPTNQDHYNKLKKLWQHSETIFDFDSIDTAKDWESVKSRIDNKKFSQKIKKLNTYSILLKVAAVIVALIGITIIIRYYLLSPPELITISTGINQSEIVLPDDSKIYLNENSTLSYPEKFTKKGRLVNLDGEAYFEVSRDEKRSFKIFTTNSAVVEVLGTAFNVNTDTTSSEVMVHVTNGEVAFYQTNNPENKVILQKNEKAVLANDNILKSAIDDPNFLSWKTGLLKFKNRPLKEVVNDLSDYYKRDIVLMEESSQEYKYTSTINNQTLDEVLEEITLVFNLDITTRNDTIFILPNQ